MKIKEVSQKLNVTQKTVRFYEEQGFLNPAMEEKNGRRFREYSLQDIKTMEMIIQLRKMSFSVEEIRMLFQKPERMESVCRERKEQLVRQYEYGCFLLEVFEKVHFSDVKDIFELYERIKTANHSVKREHMEWQPLFQKLDEEFSDREFEKWEAKREKQKRNSVYMFAVLNSPYCKSVMSGYMNTGH